MSRASCAMRPLVAARRDGRLGEREVASLERHLVTCEACRASAQRLARIAERVRLPTGPAVTPLEHQRHRLELLRTAAQPRRAGARLVESRAMVLVAATALAVALLALLAARPAPVVLIAARMPPVKLPAPARAETTVRASPGARFERASQGGVERVDLAEGTLDLEVRPLRPDERFVVATSDAEVEVRGTIFRVDAHEGRLAGVRVDEGKVEVRHHGGRALVLAGGTWSPPPEAPPSPPDKSARAPLAARPPTARREPAGANASNDFADGVALIERGDYATAAEKLDAFRAAHPGDARAEDAAYLAVIAAERAGRPEAAAAAARRYLALYPSSARSAAVRAILGDR